MWTFLGTTLVYAFTKSIGGNANVLFIDSISEAMQVISFESVIGLTSCDPFCFIISKVSLPNAGAHGVLSDRAKCRAQSLKRSESPYLPQVVFCSFTVFYHSLITIRLLLVTVPLSHRTRVYGCGISSVV